MSMTFPDFDEGKSIGYRPCDTLANSFGCIVISSDESISCLGIRITLEFTRKGLARYGINTSSREALYSGLFIQIEPEYIEVSPD